jgi:RND family efflux transporter MFP subunit
MARAQGRFQHASAQLQLARKKGATQVALEEGERATADRDDATAALKVAQAGLGIAKLRLDSARIVAPFSGRIGRPSLTVGSFVSAGTTVLTTLVATDHIHIAFDLDERTFLTMQREARGGKKLMGATVLFGLANENDWPHRATVDFVANEVDARAGTIRVRAVVTNAEDRLLPGLFVRVRLPLQEQQVLLVPQRSVRSVSGQSLALIVSDKNVVEQRVVKTGWLDEGMRVVKDGLKPTDRVILSSTKELQPGMAVEPERPSTPATSSESPP